MKEHIIGLDIFNLAIFPALTYNAETWLDTPRNTFDRLENLQYILIRSLLAVPNSAPLPALNWDVGQMSIEHEINKKKLMFLHYLINLDKSFLASEIFNVQKDMNFPGFIPEVKSLLALYELPNILEDNCAMKKQKWAAMVKVAVKNKFENELKTTMNEKYSKLRNSKLMSEEFDMKEYIKTMNLSDARTNFRIRCSLLNQVKMNQRSQPTYAYQLWACDECGCVDTQSHIMWCPSYATLREGLDVDNDLDVVHYFQKVVKIREALRNED